MLIFLSLAAQAVQPSPQPEETFTLGYDDLTTLMKHAEEFCPLALEENVAKAEGAKRFLEVWREQYPGSRFILLEAACGVWMRGYGAGRKAAAAEQSAAKENPAP